MQALSRLRSCFGLWPLAPLFMVASLWVPSRAAAQQGGQPEKPKPSGTSSYDQVTPVLLGQEDFETMMAKDMANKGAVEDRQKRLLEERYDLSVRVDPRVTMTRGKPIPVGPATKLPSGMTWEKLSETAAADIRENDLFPKGFLPLPHPKHEVGGMVFPQEEVKKLARLARFDIDFDLPAHFLPEFPPAIFLTTRHDLGDVSQGQVVTADNYYELFNGILNAKDMEGMRLLVTQFPQQQFNATADRKAAAPAAWASPAWTAMSTATRRGRPTWWATSVRSLIGGGSKRPSLRGVYTQRLFGSQRALKSIEDFTEFEQRAAYFDGDHLSASAKGVNPLDRGSQVHFMSEVQELFDFPPAPGLSWDGKLDPKKFAADSPEMRRPDACSSARPDAPSCHPAPFYTDNFMHDLQVERFYKDADDQRPGRNQPGADQDLLAAWHQGVAALLPRRPAVDAGGHGRVLQSGSRAETRPAREGGAGRLPPTALSPWSIQWSRDGGKDAEVSLADSDDDDRYRDLHHSRRAPRAPLDPAAEPAVSRELGVAGRPGRGRRGPRRLARRELEEETGITGLELEQLHAFGAPHRDPRGRFVTVAYYTLVRPDRLNPRAASDAANVHWFAVDDLPSLAFDHAEIIVMARHRLRKRLEETAAAFGFFPNRFTLNDLRAVHEIVRGKPIDSRKFRRWALAVDLVEEAAETRAGGRHRSRLYRAKRRESS